MRNLLTTFVAATCLAATAAAAKKQPDRKPSQCFLSRDYQSFRPIDEYAMYIRVGVSDIYRITLEGERPRITYPDARLITVVRGRDEICGPLDWDLRVSQGPPDIATPCIVKSQTPLSPVESAAIPRAQRP